MGVAEIVLFIAAGDLVLAVGIGKLLGADTKNASGHPVALGSRHPGEYAAVPAR